MDIHDAIDVDTERQKTDLTTTQWTMYDLRTRRETGTHTGHAYEYYNTR